MFYNKVVLVGVPNTPGYAYVYEHVVTKLLHTIELCPLSCGIVTFCLLLY